MSLQLAPYPAYKDAGVPWLATVPCHWQLRRAKTVFDCVDVRSKTGDEELLTVSSSDGVVPRRETTVTMFMAESYIGHKLAWPGDLVINSLWAWARGLGFAREHGIVSSAYGVYRPLSRYSAMWRYFDLLLRSKAYDWELHVRSKGVWTSRLQITDEAFLSMPVVLPPADDAEHIVRFLDLADRRINRSIRAKRRLIELLNEQKQAIIHRAITRGIGPNVRLKPSGIDWVGDVPDHWEVARLKSVLREPLTNGVFKKKDAFGSGAPLVNVADVYAPSFEVSIDRLERVEVTATEIQRYDVQAGDLFFVRSSLKLEGTGRAAMVADVTEATVFECHVVRGRPNERRVNRRFLMFLMNSYGIRHQAVARARTVTMSTLDQADLGCLPVILPPMDEQLQAIAYIESESSLIDAASDRTGREIAFLREYRTRLIADIVTGKLDVRGVELPPLDDDEPVDDIDAGDEADADAIAEELGDAD